MKMKAFLMFVLLFLCSMGTKAQDLGANYNENIDYPITERICQYPQSVSSE